MTQDAISAQTNLPVAQPKESSSRRLRYGWWLALLLLLSMMVPIWATPQPIFGDYTNHLLQAHVTLHYDDPHLAYSSGYDLVSTWYLQSTALSTVLLVALGSLLPIELAGRVVLSLYLLLFLCALTLLLTERRRVWPFLLLAPLLAYNFTFTTGFINFSYGIAIGMLALYTYLQWTKWVLKRYLWALALLLVLTYLAHILAWALWLVVIATLAAETLPPRRLFLLFVAMLGALPLLLMTRPNLAVAALFIAPIIWLIFYILRVLRIPWYVTTIGIMAVIGAGYRFRVVARLPEPLQGLIFPYASYIQIDKLITPLKLFSIPHQFTPPDPLLTQLNVAIIALLVLLIALLIWNAWRQSVESQVAEANRPWWNALVVLVIVYALFPTRTYDIVFIEPRVLLVTALLALLVVPLPQRRSIRERAVALCMVALCLVTIAAFYWSTAVNARRVQSWLEQVAHLSPAQSVLVLYDSDQRTRSYDNALRFITSVYDGHHLANLYTLEHGGFNSVTFGNGPLRLHPNKPLPGYWSGFDNVAFIAESCSSLRVAYDGVLVLETPVPEKLVTELDHCFGNGLQMADMSIWRR